MPITKDAKKKIISDFKSSKQDTGSTAVQVALLTGRINQLGDHFKAHVKDNHSRHGLIKMVGQRKRLLSYLQNNDPEQYQSLISRLDLRK